MEENSLQFAQPIWLAAGVAACAIVVWLYRRFDKRREADLAKLIHPRFRLKLAGGYSPRLRNFKRVLLVLALLLCFVAVARPQKGHEWREVKRKGIDILFAVDTSRSMLAEDLTPNRLERARLGIMDFVDRLEGDRVGLIPFAGSAFALCPLTLDYDAFRDSLNALDTDLIPRQGTDLASAVKEAERLFDEAGNNHRVLVLLTDGEDLQGSVADAIEAAGKKGMAIYTVGVGSAEGVSIPIIMRDGRKDLLRDQDGKVVNTRLDEQTLKTIAEGTKGLYVPLGRGAEGLDTIYREKLRLVPKSERDQRMEKIPLERFEWPLGLAILLLLLESFVSDRRREKKARPVKSAARIAKVSRVSLLAAGLFGFGLLQDARASESSMSDPRQQYNQGTTAYSQGDFAKATESLQASLRTGDLSLQQRSYYNLGNTLYRTGQGSLESKPEETIKSWEASIKAYQDALSLNDSDEDSKFNKEFVEKKLEELKKQQNKEDPKDDQKDQKDESGKEGENPKQDGQNQDKEEPSKDGKDSNESKDGKDPKKNDDKDGSGDPQKPGEDDKKGKDQKPGDADKDSKGDKKDGDKAQQPGAKNEPGKNGADQKQGTAGQETAPGEMTREEAMQLLDALRQDERNVIPIPQDERSRYYVTPQNSTNGKTW